MSSGSNMQTHCGTPAEKVVFDTITTGAANDIEKATKLARAMITKYGMSEFGMVALETAASQYLVAMPLLPVLRNISANRQNDY